MKKLIILLMAIFLTVSFTTVCDAKIICYDKNDKKFTIDSKKDLEKLRYQGIVWRAEFPDGSTDYYSNGSRIKSVLKDGSIMFYGPRAKHLKTIFPDGKVIHYNAETNKPMKIVYPDGTTKTFDTSKKKKTIKTQDNNLIVGGFGYELGQVIKSRKEIKYDYIDADGIEWRIYLDISSKSDKVIGIVGATYFKDSKSAEQLINALGKEMKDKYGNLCVRNQKKGNRAYDRFGKTITCFSVNHLSRHFSAQSYSKGSPQVQFPVLIAYGSYGETGERN